ncbi:MAG: PCMD domain-containing protein [Bacteroidales bacterium]|nr:PCMD domain-containing protein [Bacteroidales bacterium]
MKKLLLLTGIVTLLFSFQLIAQVVPNGSFEDWENFGNYENPYFWDTPNPETSLVGLTTVTKEDSVVYDGTYSARLTTLDIIGIMIAPGLLTLGSFDVDFITQEITFGGGEPFTDCPAKLTGWYKYTPAGSDFFSVSVYLTKNTVDTIAVGAILQATPASEWTQFEVPLIYFSAEDPDTVNMIIMSSLAPITPGSVLLVDKLEFQGGVGIEEELLESYVDFYHDQSNQTVQINYHFTSEQTVFVSLFNIVGQPVKKLRERKVMNGQEVIDLRGYPAGIYLIEVRSGSERMVKKLIF